MVFYLKNNFCNDPRESKKLDRIAVFYGRSVLAIPNHEKNMQWTKRKYVQVGSGFPT